MGFFSDWYHLGFDFAVDGVKLDIGSARDKVKEASVDHPVATSLAVATVSGAVGYATSGTIASAIGSTGALGKASTGTAINVLSGAALESASKTAIGGTVKGGEAVISATCAATGGAVAATVVSKDK